MAEAQAAGRLSSRRDGGGAGRRLLRRLRRRQPLRLVGERRRPGGVFRSLQRRRRLRLAGAVDGDRQRRARRPPGRTRPLPPHAERLPELQNVEGGIALDSWSSIQSPNPITAHTLVDDDEVEALCNPLAGIGAVETVSETFQFTEGPLWRGDHLLFTDVAADTIYRFDPPGAIGVFRAPSGQATRSASTSPTA